MKKAPRVDSTRTSWDEFRARAGTRRIRLSPPTPFYLLFSLLPFSLPPFSPKRSFFFFRHARVENVNHLCTRLLDSCLVTRSIFQGRQNDRKREAWSRGRGLEVDCWGGGARQFGRGGGLSLVLAGDGCLMVAGTRGSVVQVTG